MRKISIIILFSAILFSCNDQLIGDDSSDNPKENFEALWTEINTKYSYFKLKNIDWNKTYTKYKAKIDLNPNILEEFNIYSDMLYELQDGHVNLSAGFDLSRNWEWYLNYPENFNSDLIERHYLNKDYFITGGLKHRLLDHKYAYIRYASFSSSISGIDLITTIYKDAKGIIIDLRNNGGGSLKNAQDLVNRFANKKKVVLKTYYKNGPGKQDFSAPDIFTTNPSGSYRYYKPIVLLTNRKCYSATSFFVMMMKQLPNVTVLGDYTGGGAGIPASYMLPNGWILRYSSGRSKNAKDEDFELGVAPDIKVDLDLNLLSTNKDSYIEQAKKIID